MNRLIDLLISNTEILKFPFVFFVNEKKKNIMIVDETFLAGKYVRNKKSFHSSY